MRIDNIVYVFHDTSKKELLYSVLIPFDLDTTSSFRYIDDFGNSIDCNHFSWYDVFDSTKNSFYKIYEVYPI